MEYVLLGALLLGILLFLVAWLAVVGVCFQRHPVTGLIALLPGINLLVLPATWHRVSGWVVTGVVGVLLAGVAWFAGANQHVYRYIPQSVEVPAVAQAKPGPAPAPAVAAEPVPVALAPVAPAPPAPPAPPTPAELLAGAEDLPTNALYHVVFEPMGVSELPESTGKYVRITQKDGHRREGKVNTASTIQIELEERSDGDAKTRTIKMDEIREAFLMTRKQGGE